MDDARTSSPTRSRRRGFTLVEIMIVVVIIGVLATLAIPSLLISRANAKSSAFINDLRQARAVFESYVLEHGAYPADVGPGVVPTEFTNELSKIHWTDDTPIGGQWEWDYKVFGATAGVSVVRPAMTDADMTRIDERIDDGNTATGVFRQRANGYIYIIE